MDWKDKGENRPVRKLLVLGIGIGMQQDSKEINWGQVADLDQGSAKSWREMDGYEKILEGKIVTKQQCKKGTCLASFLTS